MRNKVSTIAQASVLKLTTFFSAVFLLSNIILLPNAHAESQDDAWEILHKAAVAGHVLSYTGVFVCTQSKKSKAVQIKHVFNGRGEYSRNVTLDTSPREVFSEGRNLVIYHPHKEKVVIRKRHAQNLFPNVIPVELKQLKKSYTLYGAHVERVAGRPARVFLMIPKDNLRYSYKFWVDQAYGLLMRYEMRNANREVLESITFNELNLIENLDLDWYQPQIDTNKYYEMEEELPIVPDETISQDWAIETVPHGYRKIDQMKMRSRQNAGAITQLIFSDGMAAVSLFLEPLAEGKQPNVGYQSIGSTSAYAGVQSGYQITVVGDVPKAAVTQFGQSVIFHK